MPTESSESLTPRAPAPVLADSLLSVSCLAAMGRPTAQGSRRRRRRRQALASCLAVALALAALPARAHVTPNVSLVKRGEFVKQTLPAASQFLEQQLTLPAADLAAIKQRTHWTPSEEDAKIYLGRDAGGRLVGIAVFVWMPSEHGPLGLATAFDPAGRILQTAVTDVGSEPLAWVKPLLQAGGLAGFTGLALDADPAPQAIAPGVTGAMSRYYAEVIASAVARTQAMARVSLAAAAK
jgi:hypothetical protein